MRIAFASALLILTLSGCDGAATATQTDLQAEQAKQLQQQMEQLKQQVEAANARNTTRLQEQLPAGEQQSIK